MSLVNIDFESRTKGPLNGAASNSPSPKKRNDIYSLDILDLMRRKFWLILFFVLLGMGLSTFYYLKAPKTFESTANVFVDEKTAPSMNTGERDPYINDTSIEQYLVTLQSTKILAPAIDKGSFHNMNMFEGFDDILLELREGDTLTVSPADSKSNSGVMRLAVRGNSQAECQQALAAIVDSFNDHIQATTKNIGGEHAEIVQKTQNEWLTRLKEVEQEIEGLSVQPELISINGQVTNRFQSEQLLLREDLHELQKEKNKVLALIETIKQDQRAGRESIDLVTEIMTEQSDVSDSAYARTQDQLVILKVEQQELLNSYGPDHPQVQAIQRKIAAVDELRKHELDAMKGMNREKTQQRVPNAILVADFLKQMERKAVLLEAEEFQVQSQIDATQQRSTEVSAVVEKLNSLQRERERLEAGYYAIIERMSEMNALKEHLWRNLSVLDPPSIGEEVAPKLSLCLGAGFLLGSLIGLAFAGFKDIAEKTFHSSDDVGELLNSNVIGHVGQFQRPRQRELNPDYSNVIPEVVALHAPASQPSEAYRSIRTAIFFQSQQQRAKVIQITSPIPGDGKSTTASNLAASIAQSGRSTLLIDADLRKPTQHNVFGINNDKGLSSLLTGEARLEEVVSPVIPDYLSMIPAGPIMANPAELLTSARFASVLKELRSQYDYILVDTPPLLAVTDPSIVCSHVDLIYFVMRIRNGIRSNSLRAKEIVDRMNINLGGVIINGLRRRDQNSYSYSGEYGYGSYGSYGAGATYGQTARVSRPIRTGRRNQAKKTPA